MQYSWGVSYEEVLTWKRGASGPACGTCNGSGYAGSTAASTGGLLRLDRRVYRLQRRFDTGPRSIKVSPIRCCRRHGPGKWERLLDQPQRGYLRASTPASSGSGAPGFWVPKLHERVLQRVSEHEWCCSPAAIPAKHLRAQDNQPVHSGPATGLRRGSVDDLCDGGRCFGDLKTAACSQVTDLCNQANLARFNGQSRNNGWYAGGGLDYMVHKGPLVDVVLGVEYQHYDVGSKNAFCFNPGCNPATGWDEDLSAKGDIVRARLTIKTSGYRFFY